MGCSTSKNATLLGSSELRVKKKFCKSHSFAPLRSHSDKPMHFDYHVVALTSSTYGIMKLVESENVNELDIDASAPAAAGVGPMYSKMRKSESMPARSKGPQTWTDMAMGISRMTVGSVQSKEQEEEESVKTPLNTNEEISCSEKWEQELETINTWELMAGLDDLTPRPSPLPLPLAVEAPAAVASDDSSLQNLETKPVMRKGKTLSRSRSLSSIEDLKVATVVELEGATLLLMGKQGPASVTDSSSQTLFSKFSSAAQVGYRVPDDDSTLFDPDILASFASSADGRTETSESDEWCRDAMASTSASLADEDVTSQWTTSQGALQDQNAEAIMISRASSPDQTGAWSSKLSNSFAKMKMAPDLDLATTTTSLVDSQKPFQQKLRVVSSRLEAFERKCPPGGDERVVLYTTSLRGIRKTYEDCNSLRMIFQSYQVWIDERDISMHADFRQELKLLLTSTLSSSSFFREGTTASAAAATGPVVQVPRVFIMGHYIGGLEQVLPLHEEGKLGELLINLAPQPHPTPCCDGCGGIRFVPCPDCSGSCKINTEDNQIARCPDCNENGLIRCPICF